MNKYLKIGIIFLGLLILLVIISILLSGSNQEGIKTYLINNGYTQDSDDETRLFKLIDSDTINYFSVADYTFTQNINESNSSFYSSLTSRYDFKNHELTYNYRITYSNNINVIFNGSYNEDVFTCNKEFSTATITESEYDNTCGLIKIKVERFYKEASILFKSHRLVEYMESVNLE